MDNGAIKRQPQVSRPTIPLAYPNQNEIHTIFVYTIVVQMERLVSMKNITLSAEEHLIEAARERARDEKTTLNAIFRTWLSEYTNQSLRMAAYDAVVEDVCGTLEVGKKLTRDEMNAR